MGKPATTIGCNHFCPQSKHGGGGPVNGGSSNVFYEGKSATRQNDPMICARGMDAVASGSSSVFINGRPAARMGDPSVHGGKITSGASSVFIG